MAVITSYRDLTIWNEAMDLCERIYHLTGRFPKNEQYGLVIQMRRAVVSIPSNIAEGFVRKHPKEFKNFLSISLASIAELDTQLTLSARLNYIPHEDVHEALAASELLSRRITKFYKGIRT